MRTPTLRITAPITFIKQLLKKPGRTGAVLPSSTTLASTMGNYIPKNNQKTILELGAGTGAITKALIKSGIDINKLIVVEISPIFKQILKKKFPNVNIQKGNAGDLHKIIPTDKSVGAIISGLPLKSLPAKEVYNILKEWKRILSDDGVIIQFTYDLITTHPKMLKDFNIIATKHVWLNIPPARVLVLKPKR